jgi:glycerol-3-phosphate cytidylyltransferase
MSTVLTYGTFDLFHIGHVRLLRRLSGYGDRLIVGCSTDEMPYDQRCEILNACKFVSKIIPENSWEQKEEDIIKENVKVFGIGDDWRGAFDHLSQFCRVVYLPRTEGISTTELREAVKTMYHLG